MKMNADLHTHSYYSDGLLSPKELVRLAKKRGIKYLALTDHNTVKGIYEAIQEGKKIGIDIVPAVEIKANDGEILGYFIDFENKELIRKLRENRRRIEENVKKWCKKLKKAKYDVSFEDVKRRFPKADNIMESHVVYVLYSKGYGNPVKLIEKFRNDEKLKADEIKLMTMIQAIKLVKNAGGVPVLAHPWIGETEKNFEQMNQFIRAGLRGIEINNGDRAPFKKKGMNKKIREIARKHNLILTSGSDYHGEEIIKFMPGDHSLGKNNCSKEVVEKLRKMSTNYS